MAKREFKIDVYQTLFMVERAWLVGVTPRTIQNCWMHTHVLSGLIESEREETRHLTKISEVTALLEQLTLLSSESEEDEVMAAEEFINFEFEFDLNNSYKPTDEDIIDLLPSDYQQGNLDEDMVDIDDVVQHVGLDVEYQALKTLQTLLEQQQKNIFLHVKSI